MLKERHTSYGIDVTIENHIRKGEPFTMIFDKDTIVYERVFTPIGKVDESANAVYKHYMNTYNATTSNEGKSYSLSDHKVLDITSTIKQDIFIKIRALEINGYKLVPNDWKVK